MSDEYNIRIGTKLDTSGAREDLANFIKNNGNKNEVPIDVKLGDGLKNSVKDVKKDITSLSKMASKIDLSNKMFDKSNIKGIISDIKQLEKIDLSSLSTQLQIDETRNKAQQLGQDLRKALNDVNATQLQEQFNSIKINPLLDKMNAVKEVLSAKQLDTSGVDNLIERMSVLKQVTDWTTRNKLFKGITDDFRNLQVTMDITDVKTAETALKHLQSYRNDLVAQKAKLSIEVDSSQIKNIDSQLKNVDSSIARIKGGIQDTVGKSIETNLGNVYGKDELAKLKKQATDNKKEFDSLKKSVEGFSKTFKNINPNSLDKLHSSIESMNKDFATLDMNNLNIDKVGEMTNRVAQLKNEVQHASEEFKQLDMSTNFANNVNSMNQQLTGLLATLTKSGQSTKEVNKLKKDLDKIVEVSKTDLKGAEAQLNNFMNAFNQSTQFKMLGNSNGDLQQYNSIVKDIIADNKRLAQSFNEVETKNLQNNIKQSYKALQTLESGFNQYQIAQANMLKAQIDNNQQLIANKSIESMSSRFDKMVTKYNSVKSGKFSGFIDNKDIATTNKQIDKITNAFNSLDISTATAKEIKNIESNIGKLEGSISQLESKAKGLHLKEAFDVKTQNTEKMINGLHASLIQVGQDTSKIKELNKELGQIKRSAGTNTDGALGKLNNFTEKIKNDYQGLISGTTGGIKQYENIAKSLATHQQQLANGISDGKMAQAVSQQCEREIKALAQLRKGFDETTKAQANMVDNNIKLQQSLKANNTVDYKEKFNVDGKKVATEINGITTALIGLGKGTAKADEFKKKFDELSQLSKTKPEQAVAGLKQLSDNMTKFAQQNDLKNISGTVQQYKQIAKELADAQTKLSKTTDNNIAKSLQKTIDNKVKALSQLEKSFNATQKSLAQSNLSDSLTGNLEKSINKFTQIKAKLGSLDVGKIANNGELKKTDELINSIEGKLNSLNTKKITSGTITEINSDIAKLETSVGKVENKLNNLQLKDTFTTQLDNINKKFEGLQTALKLSGKDSVPLDGIAKKIKEISSTDMSKGIAQIQQINAEMNKLGKDMNLGNIEGGIKQYQNIIDKMVNSTKQLSSGDLGIAKKAQQELNEMKSALDGMYQHLSSSEKQIADGLNKSLNLSMADKFKQQSDEIRNTIESLRNTLNSLKTSSTDFVDIGKITALENYLTQIEGTINSLDFSKMNGSEIVKINGDLNTVKNTIANVRQESENLKLTDKFNINVGKTERELNGIHASLLQMGRDTSTIEKLKAELNDLKNVASGDMASAFSKLQSIMNKMNSFKISNGIKGATGDLKQFKQILNDVEKAQKSLANSKNTDFAKGYEQSAKRGQSALKQLTQSFSEYEKAQANAMKDDVFNKQQQSFDKMASSMEAKVRKMQSTMANLLKNNNYSSQFADIGKGLDEAISNLQSKAERLRNELMTALNKGTYDSTALKQMEQEIEKVETELNTLGQKKLLINCASSIDEIAKLKSEMTSLGNETSALDKLENEFLQLGSSIKESTVGVDEAIGKFNKLSNSVESMWTKASSGTSGGAFVSGIEGFFGQIESAFSNFGLGMLINQAIMSLGSGIKETITGLDSALTDVARVLPDNLSATESNLKGIADSAKGIAIEVGQSTEDVISGMATALRAGANTMQQATEIARSSAIFQNVTDMSAQDASQAVASIVNQYYDMNSALAQSSTQVGKTQKDYKNLTEAMDIVNYAGNNFAISSEGVAQALQRGGSVLSNYNVSLADSVAMISGANESLQNPEKVGNGLKTIAINLAGMKTSAKDGTLELNKTALALKEIAGIDIYTDKSKTTVKDMMTIMDELKGKWDTLTDAQQKGLAEGIAGKQQSQVFQALMSGWSRVKQFQDEYNKGWMVGSAQRENELFMDSIAGKWNTLKENMKSVVTGNVSTSFVKDMLDGANQIVVAVDKISASLGKIGTMGAIAGLATLVKTLAHLSSFGTNGVVTMFDFTGMAGQIVKLSTLFSSGALLSNITSFGSAIKTAFASEGVLGGLSAIKSGVMGLGEAVLTSKGAMVLFQSALSAIGWGVLIAGIALAVKSWYDYAHATENAVKASKERQDGIRDTLQTLSSQKSGLSQYAKEYDTLTSKSKLSLAELQKLKQIKQEIAQMSPELVSGYDSNGDPILKLNGSLTDYIKNLDKAIAKQQEMYNAETKIQAQTYKTDGSDTKKYSKYLQNDSIFDKSNTAQYYSQSFKNMFKDAWGFDVSARDVAKDLNKYYDSVKQAEAKKVAEFQEERKGYIEKNQVITQDYINSLADEPAFKKMTEKSKSQVQSWISSWDVADLTPQQFNNLDRSFSNITKSLATNITQLGSKGQEMTRQALSAFRDTGDLDKFGKSLAEIGKSTGKFDITNWQKYADGVKETFKATGDMDKYNASMKVMADTLSEITGLDPTTTFKMLTDKGDLVGLFDANTAAVERFMNANNKSITDTLSGTDKVAMKLKEQAESMVNFGSDLRTKLATDQEIEVSWLIDQKEDLPSQLQGIIDMVTADGKVTEVEEKLLLAFETELENTGEITKETEAQIKKLFDNKPITSGIEIGGIKFNQREALQLQEQLSAMGISYDEFIKKLNDNGLDGFIKQIEEVNQKVSGLKFGDKVKEQLNSLGMESTKSVDAITQVLDKLKNDDVRVNFIAEAGEFFSEATSMEDAINKIKAAGREDLLLKYHIKTDGVENLDKVQTMYDKLPKEIRTQVNGQVFGYNDVERLSQLVDQVGEKNAVAFLSVEGASEAFAEASDLHEFLINLQGLVVEASINATVEGEEDVEEITTTIENADGTTSEETIVVNTEDAEKIKAIQEALDLLDGKESKSKYTVETDTKDLDEAEKKQNNANGKETKSKYTVEANTKELDEAEKKQNNANGKETKSTHKVEAKTEELEESKKKQDQENGRQTSSTHTANANDNKLQVTEEKLDKLDGLNTFSDHTANSDDSKLNVTEEKIEQLNGHNTSSTHTADSIDNKLQTTEEKLDALDGHDTFSTHTANTQGDEKLEKTKEQIDNMPTKKETQVDVKTTLTDTIDNLLVKAGLKKSTANLQINITCNDQATPILNNIMNMNFGQKTVVVTCPSAQTALQAVQQIQSTQITSKNFQVTASGAQLAQTLVTNISNLTIAPKYFTVSCQGGSTVAQELKTIKNINISTKNVKVKANTQDVAKSLGTLAQMQISDKHFSIVCNDQASTKVDKVISKKISDKSFTINCTDKATSKIDKIISKKISDKTFSVTCTDNASSKLSSIINKLSSIKSKSVNVTATTTFKTVGQPTMVHGVGTKAIEQPQIVDLGQNQASVQALGDATVNTLNNSTRALNNSVQAIGDNTDAMVSTTAWKNGSKNIATDTTTVLNSLKYNVDLLKNMNTLVDTLSANFSRLEVIKDRAFGGRKTALLQEEIDLMKKEQNLIVTNIANMSAMQSTLKSNLKSKGFTFDADGKITNYNSKLIAMQKNVEALQKKMDDYKGDNESTKDSLSKAYNNANDALQLVNQELEKYLSLSTEIPNSKKQWEELYTSIQKAKNEIYEANKEQQNFNIDNKLTTLGFQDKDIANQISSIERQMSMVTDDVQNEMLREKIALLTKQQQIQNKLYESTKQQQQYDMAYLRQFGATFDDLGNMTNDVSFLNNNKTKDEYESIKKAYDAYNEAQHSTLPSITAQWEELAGSIYEANKKIQENTESLKENLAEQKKMLITAQDTQLNAQLSNLKSRVEAVDKIIDLAYGSNKTKLMQKRIDLLKEENAKNKELYEFYKAQKGIDKEKLILQYGVHFDDNGNIRDLQTQLEKLSTKEEKDALMELANSFISNYENSEKFLASLYDMDKAINDTKDDITKLAREIAKLKDDSWVKKYTNDIDVINNKLERNKILLELQGQDTYKILNENIGLYDDLAKKTQDYINYEKKRRSELSNTLITYGFKINDDGTIDNVADKLVKLKDTLNEEEFGNLQDDLNSYFDITLETLPKLENELLTYKKEQESIQKEKLETTKKVEEEITKIVKKQIDKRIEEIEKEKDARVKALNESKDAYNKWRDEVDYNNDYDEQLSKVKDLEKQLEVAKRDTSLSGQKRVEELMKDLQDEQKNLEKLVQDKIDKDVNTMFDDQITSIEEKADKEKEALEDTWDDAKIAETVRNAINTGLFTDIDGNIQALDKALMDFANDSSDYLGVMGESLKTELLENLNIALETMKELNAEVSVGTPPLAQKSISRQTDEIIATQQAKVSDMWSDVQIAEPPIPTTTFSLLSSNLQQINDSMAQISVSETNALKNIGRTIDEELISKTNNATQSMESLNNEQDIFRKLIEINSTKDMSEMYNMQMANMEETIKNNLLAIASLWNDSNLPEDIRQAMQTNDIMDMEDTISGLSNSVGDLANNSVKALNTIGNTLKTELLDNLNIALDTIMQMEEMTSSLAIPDLSQPQQYIVKNIIPVEDKTGTNERSLQSISFGDTNFTIEGSIDENVLPNIEKVLQEHKDDIYKEILKFMK